MLAKYGICPSLHQLIVERRRGSLNEPLTLAAWTSKPSWQVRTLDDMGIAAETQRFEADRAHSHVTEVHL